MLITCITVLSWEIYFYYTVVISRFNVDCSSSTELYGGVEGAFGVSVGSGGSELQCAAPTKAECQGAVSNCWSPGQRDTGQSRQQQTNIEWQPLITFRLS